VGVLVGHPAFPKPLLAQLKMQLHLLVQFPRVTVLVEKVSKSSRQIA
jgi:hypothetical protein